MNSETAGTAKMVIEAYADAAFTKRQGQYAILFNPENYSLVWNFGLNNREKVNGGNTVPTLYKVRDANFKMTFIIDGTGVGAAALGKSKIVVASEIWSFLELATILNKNGKRKAAPPFCRLVWANLTAKCQVETVTMKITLLNRDGTPLRASLDVTFRSLHYDS